MEDTFVNFKCGHLVILAKAVKAFPNFLLTSKRRENRQDLQFCSWTSFFAFWYLKKKEYFFRKFIHFFMFDFIRIICHTILVPFFFSCGTIIIITRRLNASRKENVKTTIVYGVFFSSSLVGFAHCHHENILSLFIHKSRMSMHWIDALRYNK